jgi:hypothetical protein
MDTAETLRAIAAGRTDLVIALLGAPGGAAALTGPWPNALAWCVYHGDVTALRAVRAATGGLGELELDRELGHAAFMGHWKMADFLVGEGADPRHADPETGETALHSALSKAGRPHRLMVVRLLLERGADPNAATIPGRESGAFMRDVRTRGETPLHRAAAYADAPTIELLLAHGANKQARDAHGDSPLSWASWHLRPGAVLSLLAFPPHVISQRYVANSTADHGCGWGEAMERATVGDWWPLSPPPNGTDAG